MAKKHKKNKGFGGLLADKLKNVELSEPAAPTPAPAPPRPAPPRPEPTPPSELSDSELFAHALGELDGSQTFRGKFHGDVHDRLPGHDAVPRHAASRYARGEREDDAPKDLSQASPGGSAPEAAPVVPEEEAALREEMMFARFVGQMDAYTSDAKYAKQKPRGSFIELEPDFADDYPEGLITPTLPTEGPGLNLIESLDDSQRGLLNRARLWGRQNDMPVLNLRGDSFDDAMRQLELFIHQKWKEGVKYVRVVHGRGVGSDGGAPVLKPAVLTWLAEGGFRYLRGYAPELTPERDYGSLVVALNRDGEKLREEERAKRASKKKRRPKKER